MRETRKQTHQFQSPLTGGRECKTRMHVVDPFGSRPLIKCPVAYGVFSVFSYGRLIWWSFADGDGSSRNHHGMGWMNVLYLVGLHGIRATPLSAFKRKMVRFRKLVVILGEIER